MSNNHSQIRRHILIVDDEPAVRRTVRGVLESSGFECAESENGASALEWLEWSAAIRIRIPLCLCDFINHLGRPRTINTEQRA